MIRALDMTGSVVVITGGADELAWLQVTTQIFVPGALGADRVRDCSERALR
jgi:hypothetical protein